VGKNPTDRGKIGTKRSLLTDGGGVPIGLAVEGANRHDCKMVRETIDSLPMARPEPTPATPQGMCLDKGYDYDAVRDLLAEFGFTAHIRTRGEEAKALKQEAGFRARRWVVEAVQRGAEAIVKYKTCGIGVDLQAYVDNVRHHLVLATGAQRVTDAAVLPVLKRLLKAAGTQGLPQGGGARPCSGICTAMRSTGCGSGPRRSPVADHTPIWRRPALRMLWGPGGCPPAV
jgi:transposase